MSGERDDWRETKELEVAELRDEFWELRELLSKAAGRIAYFQRQEQLGRGNDLSFDELERPRVWLHEATQRLDELFATVVGEKWGGDKELRLDTVLIVDDEEGYCRSLRRHLQERGARVFYESDAERAVTTAVQLRPSVAVIDICMPSRDGRDVAAELRAVLPEVCIVLTTGHLTETRLFESGGAADYFFEKGHHLRTLLDIALGARPKVRAYTAVSEGLTDEAARRRNARNVYERLGTKRETAEALGVDRKTVRRLLEGDEG